MQPAMLPANLPSIVNAKLPATYKAATEAIAECAHIDECKDWADKSEALASYAKQAGNDDLRKMADRIQARAIRRCGELLREIPRASGTRTDIEPSRDTPTRLTRTAVATEAGLSRDQRVTAIRVANVPAEEFTAAVESDDPPTVTALAERGKVPAPKPLIDLQGIDPEDFKLSTQVQGQLGTFAEFLANNAPEIAVRGSFPRERPAMVKYVGMIRLWLDQLLACIEEAHDA